jgi:tRNA (guanine37-N1)-methyltransferase
MLFEIMTLFPGMFESYLAESVLSRAIERKRIEVRLHNIRDWAENKHHKVDASPYGGGPGMVLKVDCVVPCVEEVRKNGKESGRLLMLTPQGKRFNQHDVEGLAQEKRILLLCGRYEGFDERISQILQPEEISIGDYVLNGGEVAAMAVMDAVIRLIPGVLGDEFSSSLDSFSRGNRFLEGPQYTRPREYRGLEVPEVLLEGNHGKISLWRAEMSVERTRKRRPDLLDS